MYLIEPKYEPTGDRQEEQRRYSESVFLGCVTTVVLPLITLQIYANYYLINSNIIIHPIARW